MVEGWVKDLQLPLKYAQDVPAWHTSAWRLLQVPVLPLCCCGKVLDFIIKITRFTKKH